MARVKHAAGLVGVVLVVLVLWAGDAAWGGRFLADHAEGHDIYHLSNLYERAAHYVLNGHYPAWLPEFQGGYPVAAAWMYGLFYPPLLLFGVAPAEVAWTWLSLLHVAWAALGTFLLLRRSLAAPGAVAGALALALSEFTVGRILCGHLNLLMPLAWFPWVLLAIARIAEGRRGDAGWLGFCLGAGLLAGHVQMWFYLGPLAAAYAAWRAWRAPERKTAVIGCGLGFAVAFAIAAVQWLPTLELYSLGERTPSDLSLSSVPAAAVAAKAFPGFFGWRPGTYWGAWFLEHEYLGVSGLVVLFLAALGMARRECSGRWFWVVVGALGVLLAMGEHSPLGGVVGALPLVSAGREPGRALVLPLISAAVLAAHGVEAWSRADAAERRRLLTVAATVTGFCALAAGGVLRNWLAGLPLESRSENGLSDVGWPAVFATLAWLAALGGALFAATRRPVLGWALPAVILLHAATVGIPPSDTTPAGFYYADWASALPPEARGHRLLLLDERFPPVERSGIRSVRQMCHVDTPGAERLRQLDADRWAPWLDVALGIGPESAWVPASAASLTVPLRLLRFEPIGRAVFFRDARWGVSDEEAAEAITRGSRALLLADRPDRQPGPPSLSRPPRGLTVVPSPDPNRLDVTYRSAEDGWIFFSERFYPGWEATLDGERIPIHRANLMFRAVRAPAGDHTVAQTYRPAPLRWGSFLSLFGLAAAGFLVWTGRKSAPKV